MSKVSVFNRLLYIFPVVIVLSNFPLKISTEPFNIDVTVNGAKAGTNYLRIELYKDGSKNYFGETFNGKDWISSSNGEDYFPVEIKSSSTSATIQGRVGNPNDSEYVGSGSYKLKVKRYTASGNAANDDQEAKDIEINYDILPKQTEKPVETTTETETPIPTSMPEVLAASAKATINTTIIPTVIPTPILLETRKNNETNTQDKVSIIPYVFGVMGIFLIGIGGFMFVRKRKKVYNETNVQGFKEGS